MKYFEALKNLDGACSDHDKSVCKFFVKKETSQARSSSLIGTSMQTPGRGAVYNCSSDTEQSSWIRIGKIRFFRADLWFSRGCTILGDPWWERCTVKWLRSVLQKAWIRYDHRQKESPCITYMISHALDSSERTILLPVSIPYIERQAFYVLIFYFYTQSIVYNKEMHFEFRYFSIP